MYKQLLYSSEEKTVAIELETTVNCNLTCSFSNQNVCVYFHHSLHDPFQFAVLFVFPLSIPILIHSQCTFLYRGESIRLDHLPLKYAVRFLYAAGYKIEMKALVMANGSAHRGRCRHGHHRQCINCMGVALVVQWLQSNSTKNTCTCNFHVRLFIKHERIKCIYWCGFNAVSIRWNRINSWIEWTTSVHCFSLLSCLISFGAQLHCYHFYRSRLMARWWNWLKHVTQRYQFNRYRNIQVCEFHPYSVGSVHVCAYVGAKRVKTEGHVYNSASIHWLIYWIHVLLCSCQSENYTMRCEQQINQ